MKIEAALLVALSVAFVTSGDCQTFGNLGFESATISYGSSEMVRFEAAFPYWHGREGGVDLPANAAAFYGSGPLEGSAIGIYDNNPLFYWGPPPLFGNYSAWLQACPIFPASGDVELAQMGLIPFDAKSVHFATDPRIPIKGNSGLSFRVNGQSVPYFAVSTRTNYILWGADISSYAGSVAEIAFRLHSEVPPGGTWLDGTIMMRLDEISFTSQAIPEPPPAFLLLTVPACLLDGAATFLVCAPLQVLTLAGLIRYGLSSTPKAGMVT